MARDWLADEQIDTATMPDKACLRELDYLASHCDDAMANAEAVGADREASQWALSALACRYAIQQLARLMA